jgi:rhamnosyltransferase
MRYAAGITLFNPIRDFIDNLIKYSKIFDVVVVNDNSYENSVYSEELKKINNVVYYGDGRNYGLPAAFNRTLDYCYKNNIDFLCTLDQDSILGIDQIHSLQNYIETNSMADVAIVAPYPVEITRAGSEENDASLVEEVPWVICSGACLNLSVIKKAGIRYDEAYFVDRFDADFCKQISLIGLRQLVLKNVQMPHACGDENGHSVVRNYYIFRNRYYYNDKFYLKHISLIRSFLQTVRHYNDIITNQHDKIAKIKVSTIAKNDYRKGAMGIISNESLQKVNKLL